MNRSMRWVAPTKSTPMAKLFTSAVLAARRKIAAEPQKYLAILKSQGVEVPLLR